VNCKSHEYYDLECKRQVGGIGKTASRRVREPNAESSAKPMLKVVEFRKGGLPTFAEILDLQQGGRNGEALMSPIGRITIVLPRFFAYFFIMEKIRDANEIHLFMRATGIFTAQEILPFQPLLKPRHALAADNYILIGFYGWNNF